MRFDWVFVCGVQTTILLGCALGVCLIRRNSPGVRVLVCRYALLAAFVVVMASPWVARKSNPVVLVEAPNWVSTAISPSTPAPVHQLSVARPMSAHLASQPAASASIDWPAAAIALWAIGVAVLAGTMGVGFLRLAVIRRKSVVVFEGSFARSVFHSSAAVGVRAPEIRASASLSTPYVAGVLYPTLYVPLSWCEDSPPGSTPWGLEAICRHEIAHLAARDLQWRFCAKTICVLLWPQPLTWVVARIASLAAEELCDQNVLASGWDAKEYAASLLALKERATPTAISAVGIGAVSRRSNFSRRIEAIMSGAKSARRELTRGRKLGLVLACGLLGGLAATLIGSPSLPKEAPQQQEGTLNQGPKSMFQDLPGWRAGAGYDGLANFVGPAGPDAGLQGCSVGKDPKVSFRGGPTAAIKVLQNVPDLPYHGIGQFIKADEYRGKRIRLSAYLKTRNATMAGLMARVYTRDHIPSQDNTDERPLQGTRDWTRCYVVVDVPQDAVAIQFGAWVGMTGEVWISPTALEPVDPATVPNTSTPAGANIRYDLDHAMNLDFSMPPISGNAGIRGWMNEGTWIVPDLRREGKQVVTIKLSSNSEPGDLIQEILASSLRGKRVRFSAYVKTSGKVEATTTLAIPGGGEWAETPVSATPAGDGWRLGQTVVDVPNWATCLQFGVSATGAGQVWLTSCQFEVVDPQKTDLTQPPHPLAIPDDVVQALPTEPSNLDYTK